MLVILHYIYICKIYGHFLHLMSAGSSAATETEKITEIGKLKNKKVVVIGGTSGIVNAHLELTPFRSFRIDPLCE